MEAVGEVEEEAGEGTDEEEEVDHEGGCTLATHVDGGEDHLEGEERG